MPGNYTKNVFLFSLALLVVVLAKVSQKPQCINSRLIEKITFSDQSFVFNCEMGIVVPFSREYSEKGSKIQAELQAFEGWITRFLKFEGSKIQIQNSGSVPKMQKNLVSEGLKAQVPNSHYRNMLADFYVRVWNSEEQKGLGDVSSFLSYKWWQIYKGLSSRHQLDFLQKFTSLSAFKPEQLAAQFDYLITDLKIDTRRIDQINEIQRSYPQKVFGLWDHRHIYHAPSKSYMFVEALSKISAHHYIWEICDDIMMQSLLKISAQVQKVLLVKNCDQRSNDIYASYVRSGIEGFASRKVKLEFVLLDLPSLISKKEFVQNEIKIFDFISNRVQHVNLQSQLGWKSVELNPKLDFFKVHSSADSIESFRVLEN